VNYRIIGIASLAVAALVVGGCDKGDKQEIVVYCAVDEPYASQIFAEFEKETGVHVAPQYDIESSKSVGLAGKLEAERDHPRADVWWGSEAFLTVRLGDEGIFSAYSPPAAAEVPGKFKDASGLWTGCGLRALVLAVGMPGAGFEIKSVRDLGDPRLKEKVCMARPTAGSTGSHMAALYVTWGREKALDFFRRLRANNVALLGGNAEVADQVGAGIYSLGMTDSDDVSNSLANGGKLKMVVPDQDGEGTLAMPTTIALVKGGPHEGEGKKLVDFLASKECERKLIELKFVRWSVRTGVGDSIKTIDLDYRAAARVYPLAQREATAILEGREP